MKKILHAPYIDQTERWVYGCESISAVMLLRYWQLPVEPDEFIDRYLPRANSFEKDGKMYAADPTDYYINEPRDTTGWGCYAPCICTALNASLAAYGRQNEFAVKDVSGLSAAQLCKEYIDKDCPAIFWATLDFEPSEGTAEWTLPNGKNFTWKNHEHCLLLCGYDDENYWFNDPWHNHGCCPYPKALVEQRHAEQGMYAAVMLPRK